MTMPQANKNFDYAKQNVLMQLISYRLEELFEKLEVDLVKCGKQYLGVCPVHGGSNNCAINLYPEGYAVPGMWFCKTKRCHEHFGKTIIGFTRGVLSRKYTNWQHTSPKQNIVPYHKVIDWLCKFVGQNWNDLQVSEADVERHQFAVQIEQFKRSHKQEKGISRERVRASLKIPCDYFIQRGYSSEILDKYDVGLCTQSGKEMSGRVVVPIYEDTGKYLVASTGRAICSECSRCGLYHSSNECPNKSENRHFSKWRNVGNTGGTLYNFWSAKKYIKDSGSAVLVEGPGDVWRLVEAGVNNAVALFGTNLTDEQEILLEKSGAMSIALLLDNDEAGRIAVASLKERLRCYNIKVIVPSEKDVGSMMADAVRREIVPHLC